MGLDDISKQSLEAPLVPQEAVLMEESRCGFHDPEWDDVYGPCQLEAGHEGEHDDQPEEVEQK